MRSVWHQVDATKTTENSWAEAEVEVPWCWDRAGQRSELLHSSTGNVCSYTLREGHRSL